MLDSIGAAYLDANLRSLAIGGRLVLIGLMGGAKSEIGLGALLVRRLSLIGSTLRVALRGGEGRDRARSSRRASATRSQQGRIRPIVDRVLPLAQAAEAHRAMKASEHFGKIVLKVA